MQVRSLLAITVGILALAALPATATEKSVLAGNTGFSINSSGRLNLVTSVPIGYLNRTVNDGRRVINLRIAQPMLCADFAAAPSAGVNPVALQYTDPNGDSSGLLFGGIGNYNYTTNGAQASLFSVATDSRLACCVMLPASNANCFQGLIGGTGNESLFSNGFEGSVSSTEAPSGGVADLTVSVSGPAVASPSTNYVYTMTVSNVGGTSVSNVRVRDWFPKSTGAFPASLASGTWTCSATSGASCGNASGAGNVLLNSVSLDPGASINIVATRLMSAAASGAAFSVSAAAFAPPSANEDALGNNQGALSGTVQPTSLSINDVTLAEGNNGTTTFQFTITRTNTSSAASVVVNTANGTAQSGSDYTAITNQTVNFSAGGAATAVVNVSVAGDTMVEGNETFSVNLSSPSGAAIGDGQGAGTINNDDSTSISIADVGVTEGNTGTVNASFTVTLVGAVQGGFTVPVSSANGSAIAPGDYTAIAGGASVTFTGNAGETRQVTVPVVGETIVEANETFQVSLGTPSVANVAVSDGSAVGTINNDDSASVAIADVSVTEGSGGSSNAVFTVTLTGEVQGGFTLPFSTASGTAVTGTDFTAVSGPDLNFTGASGQTRTVTVPITTDSFVEANETFQVLLGVPSAANVSVSDGTAVGTINNDDSATVAINDVSVTEGNLGTVDAVFTVTLNGDVQDGFTLGYSSANGTAIAPIDYLPLTGVPPLAFTGTSGQTRTITVTVIGDPLVEANETFQVLLGAASVAGVSASDGSGVGTISNDDAATIAINDVIVVEGNTGTVSAIFTVTLTGDVQGGFSVQAATAAVTATAGTDYTHSGATLTFAGTSGETQLFNVPVIGDTEVESDELFVVNLGIPSAASVTASDGTGVGTIDNDDPN